MGLLLILPILVSGYLVCMRHPYYFSRLHRYDGQLLYLLVAKLGLFCLFFSFVACSLSLYVFEQYQWFDYQKMIETKLIDLGYVDNVHAALYAFMVQVGVISVFIPLPWTILARIFGFVKGRFTGFESAKAYYLTKGLLDTPLGKLMYRSISAGERAIIMVTMTDRKVYIGHVSGLGEPSERESPHSMFTFVPNYSGYRDKDTLKLKITTTYPQDVGIKIVLREENISTATPWNFDQWEEFSRLQDAEEKPHVSVRSKLKK
jgi:hypothetical protein